MKAKSYLLLFILLIGLGKLEAQSCNCQEYIYLNEPGISSVLKFKVDSITGALTEVLGANGGTLGTDHWYPGTGTSILPAPHGLGFDLNGNLYIGSNVNGVNPIHKLTCDGVITTTPTISNPEPNNLYNMFSIGNTLYTTANGKILAFNTCTGQKLGEVCFLNAFGSTISSFLSDIHWGLSYNEVTETVYMTRRNRSTLMGIWSFSKFELEQSIQDGSCIAPLVSAKNFSPPFQTVNIGENFIPSDIITQILGIVGTDNGDIFVVGIATGVAGSGRVLKFNSEGTYLGVSTIQSKVVGSHGIVWSRETGLLYVANLSDNVSVDCISVFDTNLTYIGTGAPNPNIPGDQSAKALSIIKECCPAPLQPFEREVCGKIGTKFYLNEEAFNLCDGLVCGSSWQVISLENMTFDPCDNSVVVNGVGCSEFTLTLGDVLSTGCVGQTTTFRICNSIIDADVSVSLSCEMRNASIDISNPMNVDSAGISIGTLYNGPDYGTGLIAVSTIDVEFDNLLPNTLYTVRIFNESNECYFDTVISTPALPNAGIDKVVCRFGTVTMTATGIGVWTADPNNPSLTSITNTSSPTTTVTGFSTFGVYNFIWTEGGCTDTVSLLVPTAGGDQLACQFETATMAATGMGMWTAQTGNPGTATITTASSPTTTITGFSAAGTYNFIWTSNGCTDTARVDVATPPTAMCTPLANTNCVNPNGTASVSTNAANPTYLWSTGATTAMINNLAAGTYTVTVTDPATGCTNTCQAVVANNTTNPIVTCDKTDNTNCINPNGTATATATGVTYLWSNNATTAMISNLAAGTYTVTVTSTTTGCTATCSATVASTTTPPSANCMPVANTNCVNPNGSGSVSTNAVNPTYLWSTGATTAMINNLATNTYTVTVTNTTTGCTNTCEAIITDNITNPMVSCAKTDNTNCINPNGTATATATGVTYLWSNNETTAMISNLAAGTYTVTVTSTTTGCTATCSAIVASTSTPPTANCTPVANTNCVNPNGTATVSTNAANPTYLWSTGATTAMINNLAADTYTVTVTDPATGCTNTCQAVVANNTTNPIVTCDKTDNTNCINPNGTATATATGVTYLWSNNATTAMISNLAAGTYTVTVTSTTTGCTATCSAVVASTTTPPSANCTPVANTNCVNPNGTASVSTNAANPTYLWSTGATTAMINNLAAGTYTVTVTDPATGCTNTCQAVVANGTINPTCSITVNTQPTCANLTGGDITVELSPAGTYTFAWSDNGVATATRTGLTGGTYTVTVTNTTSNCTGVCNVTLDTPMNCCNINAIVPQNLVCDDNGTPDKITDNRIVFSAQVSNTNTSLTGFNVTINGGTTITPNMNVPYGITQFLLGPGTAGGGATFTVTVTDSATPGCTQTFQVVDPGNCNNTTPCPTPKCGTATIQVNGN